MAVQTCKEGRKPEITAAWPEFHSPRAWLSSMLMGFSVLGPARSSRSSLVICESSLGLLPHAQAPCTPGLGISGPLS